MLPLPLALLVLGAPDPVTWLGLEPGPLPPAAAARLEADLVAAADRRAPVFDVDAHPLGPEATELVRTRVAALRDEAVDAFLDYRYLEAHQRLRDARQSYEQNLAHLTDTTLFEDILLASAEAALQAGEKGRARALLGSLSAFGSRGPRERRHPEALVEDWKQLQRRSSPPGRLELRCDAPCRPTLDGRPVANLSAHTPWSAAGLAAGPHLLSIGWPGRSEARVVTVRSGETTALHFEAPPAPLPGWALETAARGSDGGPSWLAAVRAQAEGPVLLLILVEGSDVRSAELPLSAAPSPADLDGLFERAVRGSAPRMGSHADLDLSAPAAPAPVDDGPSVWWWVAGGAALVAIGTAVAVAASAGEPSDELRLEVRLP